MNEFYTAFYTMHFILNISGVFIIVDGHVYRPSGQIVMTEWSRVDTSTWTVADLSTPLSAEVAPEIYTNPVTF